MKIINDDDNFYYDKDTRKGLAAAIKYFRNKSSLSQDRLSSLSYINNQELIEIESGKKSKIDRENIVSIIKALHLSKRDGDIVKWLSMNEADPKLVEFALSYPQISLEGFLSACKIKSLNRNIK